MLKDLAQKYYDLDYNCAESIVHAGNEYYSLGLSEHDMRMVGAFGAGMQVGDLCGALTGAACVISARYIETRAHAQKEELHNVTLNLVRAFQKKFGSRVCGKIKAEYFEKEIRCLNTVKAAAEVLEHVIETYDRERA